MKYEAYNFWNLIFWFCNMFRNGVHLNYIFQTIIISMLIAFQIDRC